MMCPLCKRKMKVSNSVEEISPALPNPMPHVKMLKQRRYVCIDRYAVKTASDGKGRMLFKGCGYIGYSNEYLTLTSPGKGFTGDSKRLNTSLVRPMNAVTV